MALRTSATFRNGWQQLREGAQRIRRARPRLAFSNAAKMARRGLADLLFPPSCLYCTAELDEATSAHRNIQVCNACLEQIEVFTGPMCARCGAPVPVASRGGEQI